MMQCCHRLQNARYQDKCVPTLPGCVWYSLTMCRSNCFDSIPLSKKLAQSKKKIDDPENSKRAEKFSQGIFFGANDRHTTKFLVSPNSNKVTMWFFKKCSVMSSCCYGSLLLYWLLMFYILGNK